MGGSKKITVGYRYFFGIHMGIARYFDEMMEIRVGDRTAWKKGQPILAPLQNTAANGLPIYEPDPADPEEITEPGAYYIFAPTLFGGDKAEGGILGTFDVMFGEPTQIIPTRLRSMLSGLVPEFRGVATVFFDGMISALNPYPKPWKFRVRRGLGGWDGPVWNPTDAIIPLAGGEILAMNPAHIIYEACTNRDWGRGLPSTRLNLASFEAAADTLLDEGFGLCIRWNRQTNVSEFILEIQNHIGANVFVDRLTGLMTIKLIRDDYDPNTLPLFTPDTGLIGLDDDDNSAQAPAVNEVIVKFRRPQDDKEGTVRVQNLASIQALGQKNTETKQYPGIPTDELAARVAQRDLTSKSGFIKRFKARLDRRGYQVQPGSAFRISDPQRGIANMILRAGLIEEAEPVNGQITIPAVLDVFGLPSAAFVSIQPTAYTSPSTVPVVIATRKAFEMPYREIARNLDPANVAALVSTAGFLGTVALRPQALALSYLVAARIGSSGLFSARDPGSFCPTATLSASLSKTETSAVLQNVVDMDTIVPGTVALIGDEMVRIDTINLMSNTITFGRGCGDTTPVLHAPGTRIWFIEDFTGIDPTEYSVSNLVQARLLTQTPAAQLDINAPGIGTDNVTMAQRQFRPYPPGNLQINGSPYPASITGDAAITWAHRDRLLQDDQLIDTLQASIGPEAGVTYTVRLFSGAGGTTLERTITGLPGTSYTYANVDEVADGGPFNPLRVTVNAVRDGLESTEAQDHQFART